ncbi:hypothetical protein LR48_Vigan03g045100 [Vigna angularis]|uniref:Uncharacterized protein n=1 Tax=Phaseolus angularis TaxID=3914 RepID=A0A0L9U2Q8_PHAAN|nr:hypothetical protein LR48_Vigan03g045100 [Vigna angularis]
MDNFYLGMNINETELPIINTERLREYKSNRGEHSSNSGGRSSNNGGRSFSQDARQPGRSTDRTLVQPGRSTARTLDSQDARQPECSFSQDARQPGRSTARTLDRQNARSARTLDSQNARQPGRSTDRTLDSQDASHDERERSSNYEERTLKNWVTTRTNTRRTQDERQPRTNAKSGRTLTQFKDERSNQCRTLGQAIWTKAHWDERTLTDRPERTYNVSGKVQKCLKLIVFPMVTPVHLTEYMRWTSCTFWLILSEIPVPESPSNSKVLRFFSPSNFQTLFLHLRLFLLPSSLLAHSFMFLPTSPPPSLCSKQQLPHPSSDCHGCKEKLIITLLTVHARCSQQRGEAFHAPQRPACFQQQGGITVPAVSSTIFTQSSYYRSQQAAHDQYVQEGSSPAP